MTETLETEETTEAPETPEEGQEEPEEGQEESEQIEGPDDPGQEDTEEPSPASDPEAWAKLERSANGWRRRVSEVLGEDALELSYCPLCPENLPGYVLPVPPDDETKAQIMAWLNPVELPEMRQGTGLQACDECNGYGNVLTGSPIPEKSTNLCAKCHGNGWTDPTARSSWDAVNPPPQPTTITPAYTPAAATGTWSPPATDNWGRPFGNPNYGRDPLTMSPDERAADPWANN